MPTHKKVKKAKSGLKKPSAGKKHAGLRALPKTVRNKMGYAKKGTKKKKAQYGAKASMAAGGKKYGSAKKGAKKSKKNWIQGVNASIKRRGTKGKCTPITKKGCTGRAKALAKTFKKMAKKRKKKK